MEVPLLGGRLWMIPTKELTENEGVTEDELRLRGTSDSSRTLTLTQVPLQDIAQAHLRGPTERKPYFGKPQ